jgi:predicted nucleic acid-binding protein
MIVVSDSTTLIILYDLDKLQYLHNIFTIIYIPPKVYEEISFKNDVKLPDFIQISKPTNTKQIEELKFLLDDGESEAIALSLEKKLPLIIDEKKGRKIAKNLSINVLGLLGVLYLNVKKEFLKKDEVVMFLDDAQKNGYRISQQLIKEMIQSL